MRDRDADGEARDPQGDLNAFAVLSIATTLVAVAAVLNAWLGGIEVDCVAAL